MGKWARETRYGMRWVATEGIFSAVKRKFGERIVSKNRDSMIAEAIQRFWLYEHTERIWYKQDWNY